MKYQSGKVKLMNDEESIRRLEELEIITKDLVQRTRKDLEKIKTEIYRIEHSFIQGRGQGVVEGQIYVIEVLMRYLAKTIEGYAEDAKTMDYMEV